MKFMKGKALRACSTVFVCVTAVLSLCGCSDIGFGDQVLLRPPRATGDKAEIQTVIGEQAGGAYKLKYPQKGKYRSAITTFEIGRSEYAVALYSTENDSKLNISVIAESDGKWDCIGTFSNKGTGVDRILLNDVNNDGKEDIVVGWSNYTTGKNTITIYSVEDGIAREMTTDETYNEMLIADITGDKNDDIVTISLSSAQSAEASLKVLQYSDQAKRPIAKFASELDPVVISLTSVSFCRIDSGISGVVIDGERVGGMLTTQIVYYDAASETLDNPLLTKGDNGTFKNPTTRKDIITSRDFDGDGITEVPVITSMPASKGESAGTVCSLTSWKQLRTNDGTLQTKLNTVINYNDGYYFILPENWAGHVTARSDAAKREVSFYLWNDKTSSVGDRLLSIQRFNSSEQQAAEGDGYKPLNISPSDGTDAVIAAQLFSTNTNDKMNLTYEQLDDLIKVL